MQILPIPVGIIDKIYTLCLKFLWTSKHPPIAWSTFCVSKENGGMGLKDLRSWNNALIAKTLWNIQMKKNTLWIKLINQIYLGGKSMGKTGTKKMILVSLGKFFQYAMRYGFMARWKTLLC